MELPAPFVAYTQATGLPSSLQTNVLGIQAMSQYSASQQYADLHNETSSVSTLQCPWKFHLRPEILTSKRRIQRTSKARPRLYERARDRDRLSEAAPDSFRGELLSDTSVRQHHVDRA